MAALIGFAGNELVARFRIKVGKEINSIDPLNSSGEAFHRIEAHEHGGADPHWHS